MKNINLGKGVNRIAAAVLLATACHSAAVAAAPVKVNVDNFALAESHSYFANFAKRGGFGELVHKRELADIDDQAVVRLNRDTIYSFGVFDLETSDLSLVLPDAGGRYLSVQVVNEGHYTPFVLYAPGTHTLTKDSVGSRYVCLVVRTFVDPNDPQDLKQVHALQDGITVEQESEGQLVLPEWDQASLTAVRQELKDLARVNGVFDSGRMFGTEEQVDPVLHLIGAAAGWGGNPGSAALYESVTPENNDGETAYRLVMNDVPVDGFWSISVYNQDGFFVRNELDAYTVNNVTADKNPDGSVTVHFGGDEAASNHLPITEGWNYLIRMYRPRQALLQGTWQSPKPKVVEGE